MSIITYQLQLQDGTERRYEVDIERRYSLPERNAEHHPEWTRLENQRCSNCNLDPQQHRYCPVALEFEEIALHFAHTASIERVDVWVHTKERSYFKNSDMQSMLKSLFGLIMASGACPILSRLKPLAHFHLPFATLEETVHRLAGTYLIRQYLKQCDDVGSAKCELDEVEELYREVKVVNLALMQRIRQATREDASINAIQIFVSITSIVEMGVEDILSRMMPVLRKGL